LGGEFDRRTLVGHAIVHGRPGPPPDCPQHHAPCRPQGKFPNAYDMDRMTETHAGAFLDRLEQAFLRF
jgi:hypothetical protein